MKTFNEYIIEQSFVNDETYINEGLLQKILGFFGKKSAQLKTLQKNIKDWPKDLKRSYWTNKAISLELGKKNNEIKKFDDKQTQLLMKGNVKEVIKNYIEKSQDIINNPDDYKNVDSKYIVGIYDQLKKFGTDLNNNDATKESENLAKVIKNNWSNGIEAYKKDLAAAENTDSESSGNNEDTTAQQEQESTKNVMDNDKQFFDTLQKAANINTDSLRDSIVGLLNKSFKEEVEEDGQKVWKWKKETKLNNSWYANNEETTVKGLASIVSGLMIINHKGISKVLLDALSAEGLDKTTMANIIKNQELRQQS